MPTKNLRDIPREGWRYLQVYSPGTPAQLWQVGFLQPSRERRLHESHHRRLNLLESARRASEPQSRARETEKQQQCSRGQAGSRLDLACPAITRNEGACIYVDAIWR